MKHRQAYILNFAVLLQVKKERPSVDRIDHQSRMWEY